MTSPLIVFAKAPRPGLVKTRMSPPLSPELAAAFYRCMLLDVLETSERAAGVLGLEPVLAVHPPDACAELGALAGESFRVVAQVGPDLSSRMEHCVEEVAASGAPFLLLRGSDSPTLGIDVLAQATRALDSHDLVLCPDRDGGYQLVGLRTPISGLFSHAMSTRSVLADTLARARARGLRERVLPSGFDLDTIDDLLWLRKAQEQGEAGDCTRTLEFVEEHHLDRFTDV